MSITNHLLVGSLIGLVISNPALAVATAYTSHFVMDAVPHYGYPGSHDFASAVHESLKHKTAHYFSYVTALTFISVIGVLIATQNYFALAIGLVAIIPDAYMTLYYLLVERRNRSWSDPITWLNTKFHGRVQFERPWAIWVEAVTFFFVQLFSNT